MKKEKLLELASKMGLNEEAVKNGLRQDLKTTEKQIVDAANFMGIK